jgi:membrane fusion protein, multidrug efflux system
VKKQYLVALGLLALIIIWMAVPRERSSTVRYAADQTPRTVTAVAQSDTSSTAQTADFTVRASRVRVDTFTRTVNVRGRTQANRLVAVRSEASGRVIATPFARGARVRAGDVLCEIAMDNREADLQEAVSRREQTRLEYEGAVDLQRRNLQSQASVAQMRAAYDSAIAAVARAELAIERTKIRAPFNGVLEFRSIEVGDYMDMGGQCATLLDDQPMLLIALVPEQDVGKLSPGSQVSATLVTGEQVTGTVSYIARAADNVARSYRIEIELNPGQVSRQGISADVRIAADEARAHLIPPSSLTMDDEGLIGIKALNRNNEVEYHRVTIVGESTRMDRPGFWVSGLPDEVVLITLGQELVVPGQRVNANFDWDRL